MNEQRCHCNLRSHELTIQLTIMFNMIRLTSSVMAVDINLIITNVRLRLEKFEVGNPVFVDAVNIVTGETCLEYPI